MPQVTLKLFKAEDIPRMDSNTMEKMKNFFIGGTKKEHVDPYFTFGFAGKEVESEVKMQCASPDWNQLLKMIHYLPLPTISSRPKLTLASLKHSLPLYSNQSLYTSHLIALSKLTQFISGGWGREVWEADRIQL